MTEPLLDKRDTDFVRENMLINYCLGDNGDLLIDSFLRNNRVDVRFDPEHFYFLMTGVSNRFLPPYTRETFSRGVSAMLYTYELTQALLLSCGYDGNAFLIKEDNSKQLGVLFSPKGETACPPFDVACRIDALYREHNRLHTEDISASFVGPYSGYAQANRAFKEARALNDLRFFGLKDCVITESLRRRTSKPCDVAAILANVRALTHTVCCGTLKQALAQADHLVTDLVAPSYSMTNYLALYVAADDLLLTLETVYAPLVRLAHPTAFDFKTLDDYRRYLHDALKAAFAQLHGVKRHPPTVLLALSFIHRNYTRPLSLAQLSEYVYANPSSLSSELNAAVGVTLSEYVGALRLSHARRLLAQEACSIAEVARQSGFTSAKYFREVFKKQTGLSPQQYRDRHAAP